MALAHKIDETGFKALSDGLKAEYKKQDDGTYVLDVTGLEDTGALKRAKDHEKEQRKAAETKARQLEEQMTELNEQMETLRTEKVGKGDKSAEVEKAWKEKLAKREKELTTQIEATQKALKTQMVDSVAAQMAAKLAGDNAEILIPHITKRLVADIADGKAVTKILGEDGEVSASTLQEFEKEILSSPKFSAVVIGSKASGGGANGARKGTGGAQKKLSEMSGIEEVQFAKENPEGYKQMLAAEAAKA